MNIKNNGNIKQLKKITSPEFVYLLGLFWADGYINKNRFTLKIVSKDFKEIERLLVHIGKLRIYHHKSKNGWKPCSQARLSDFNFCKELLKLDFDKKSFIAPTKILKRIPKRLHFIFWRGYFDGDGCIMLNDSNTQGRIRFGSTFRQDWKELRKILRFLKINKFVISRNINKLNHKYSTLTFSDRISIFRFFEYIYKKYRNIGFSRKFNKFICFINEINKTNYKNIPINKRKDTTIMLSKFKRMKFIK